MDPHGLHARGRLALLEWKPVEAIESLQSARDLAGSQPEILIDLATAYYQRGEMKGTDGAADLSLALDLLGQVVLKHPKNSVARFNRALVAERLQLLVPAIQDLEEVLRSEDSGEWRQEAQERLVRLRAALRGFLTRPPDQDRQRFVEVALEQELAAGLVGSTEALASRIQREHGDKWLAELAASRQRVPAQQIRELSTLASIRATSARGRYSTERELLRGWENSPLPPAFRAWREYEAAYRSTHSGGTFPCSTATRSAEYQTRGYHWIAANLEREAAICASLRGSLQETLDRSRHAVALAQDARLPVTAMRNEAIDAAFDYRQGRYRETLNRFVGLLARIIGERLPVVRSHEPVHNMVVSMAALGRHHASHAAAVMATAVADAAGLQSAQFADRINGANAAWRSGDRVAAAELYREAIGFFDRAPNLVATADARPWADMMLSDLSGHTSLPAQLASSRDPFVRLPYARLKARQETARGRVDDARARLDQSIRWLVETVGERNHQVWREELRATADDLLRLAVNHRTPKESWEQLQALLEMDEATLRTGAGRRSEWRPDLTFALRAIGPDVYVWRVTESGVEVRGHSGLLAQAEASIRRLRRLASTSETTVASIQSEARELSALLFGPWLAALPAEKKILFQGEGTLAEIPFPLLMTGRGELGLHHEWALTRSAISGGASTRRDSAGGSLMIDATHAGALGQWGLAPLPDPHQELAALRALPGRVETLRGRNASVANMRDALGSAGLLHFAGHAVEQNGAMSLVLHDGLLPMAGTAVPPVAVLSACSTGRAFQPETDTLSASTLAHAFVLAGAAEVVASAWNLDTLVAGEFAPAFYSRLADGTGAALHQAARHLAGREGFAHPYYWAGQMRLIRI